MINTQSRYDGRFSIMNNILFVDKIYYHLDVAKVFDEYGPSSRRYTI